MEARRPFNLLITLCEYFLFPSKESKDYLICFFQSAVIHGTFLGIKHMGTTNGGNGGLIINISSLAGSHFYYYSKCKYFVCFHFFSGSSYSVSQMFWWFAQVLSLIHLLGLHPMPSSPTYTATKHGVVGFCKSFKVKHYVLHSTPTHQLWNLGIGSFGNRPFLSHFGDVSQII